MISWIRRNIRPVNRWFEPLMAIAVLVLLVEALIFTWRNGYMPQPFFYAPTDNWMDWFNTAYWAYDNGTYDSWNTIYPPLSFVILRIFSKGSCYAPGEDMLYRHCDWVGVVSLHGFYILNVVLIALTFVKLDRKTAWPRSVALAAGLPMLVGFDRGNLVIVSFAFLILGCGPLLRSARWRWIALGCAINLKVYLVGALFPHLLRRRWRWFEGAVLGTVLVYTVSFIIVGRGTPMEIVRNILDFSDIFQAASFLDLWYAGTYGPMISLVNGSNFPIVQAIGSDLVENLAFFLPIQLIMVQAMIALAAIATWLRPEVVPVHRLTFFGVSMALLTVEAVGYTQTMILLFVFMERWEGLGRKLALVCAYLLCLPIDFPLYLLPEFRAESFFADAPVPIQYAVTVGPFIRPLLLQAMAVAISCTTIYAVWKDIQAQGWRHRWRFRRDLPLMAGPGEALPPAGVTAST